LEKQTAEHVVGEKGAKLDAVAALERPHAGEDPVALEDVDVEVDRALCRHAVDLHREVVDVLPVPLLERTPRPGILRGAGADELVDVVGVGPAAHGSSAARRASPGCPSRWRTS